MKTKKYDERNVKCVVFVRNKRLYKAGCEKLLHKINKVDIFFIEALKLKEREYG